MGKKHIKKMLFLIQKYNYQRHQILGSDVIDETIKEKFATEVLTREELDVDFIEEFKNLFALKKEYVLVFVKDAFIIEEFKGFNSFKLFNILKNNISYKTIKNTYQFLDVEQKKELIKAYNLDEEIQDFIIDKETDGTLLNLLELYQM